MDVSWNVFTILLILAGCGAMIFFYKRLASLGYFGVFLAGLVGSATMTLPTPVFPLIGALGAVLNPWLVGFVAAMGATIGDINGYLIGRVGDNFIPNDIAVLKSFMRQYGLFTLLGIAAVPGHDVTGLVAGYYEYPIALFLLATFLGKLFKFLGYSHLGKSVAKYAKRKS
jgi:membrane protein YqaA with SNARE-associated domain